jgi:hypothetical protein
MPIPLSTLVRWRHETLQLPNPEKQIIGFLRYENALKELRSDWKSIKQSSPEFSYFAAKSDIDRLSLRSRVCWEPNPRNYTLVSKGGEGKVYITNMPGTTQACHLQIFLILSLYMCNNVQYISGVLPYAAASILTQQQLISLEHRCQYLTNQTAEFFFPQDSTRLRAFYSGLQLSHCKPMTNQITALSNSTSSSSHSIDVYSPEFFCCMEWLLPLNDGMQSMFLHHVGTPGAFADNKWSNRHRIHNAYFLTEWRELVKNNNDSYS